MATRRTARATPRAGSSRPTSTRAPRRRRSSGFAASLTPEVVRSIVGTLLMALGAITLIALILPGEGALTDWWRDSIAPWFETGRWMLPFLLLGGGWYVAAGPGRNPGSGWGMTLVGLGAAYVAMLGAFEVLGLDILDVERGGGRVGRFLADGLRPLLTGPGTFVFLTALAVLGVMLAFNLRLRQLTDPVTGTAHWVLTTAADSMRRTQEQRAAAASEASAASGAKAKEAPNGRAGKAPVAVPVRAGDEPDLRPNRSILDDPAPRTSQSPLSQTVWTGPGDGGSVGVPGALRGATAGGAGGVSAAGIGIGGHAATALISATPTAQESLNAIAWTLPTIDMLEPRVAGRISSPVDHDANAQRIEEKLLSFSIPAKVTKINSGPVVTQYEVRPEHHVKVSRIEALADDLAMALAARSIRIEAPIPGKDVVGIEIPNQVSEVVGFRPLVDESQMLDSTSPLTFALGRDVSGKAYAVDLAKMPHLLVAGATGSGKSVCVNALITSLLMRARPDEVRMVLVDLKRVELAPYNGLPHLLQHVIVEPNEAKAVLNWAVREMEERYKLLAAHGVRNIAGFNSRPEALADAGAEGGAAERMPYIVLIIDELADLIMREGRKVEDPIVKIAQKARAVGIHLVLATQRPSVNVVTGLIKANVPSRIAFAMASMIDSRTVLDAPGAEDLIGRGDMLYQPVDLPRPVRMQGVFVSDREVSAVTKHWLDQTGDRTFYDEEILAFTDAEDGGNGENGQFAWLRKLGVDEMTVPAAELITTTQRASTSMLQTKLKLGFARASRVMDELERYGVIGPQDPRNPASPRQIYGPDNWFQTMEDVDDPGD